MGKNILSLLRRQRTLRATQPGQAPNITQTATPHCTESGRKAAVLGKVRQHGLVLGLDDRHGGLPHLAQRHTVAQRLCRRASQVVRWVNIGQQTRKNQVLSNANVTCIKKHTDENLALYITWRGQYERLIIYWLAVDC